MAKAMDAMRPESAPHKAYVAFRYASPLVDEALVEMKKDGVERAVAFSQFPQWSCTTMGSSVNELWRELKRLNMEGDFKWSIIDRWPTNGKFLDAVCERIEEKLAGFTRPPTILFSAHSVPMKVVQKGDPYTVEVSATVRGVMDRLEARFNAKAGNSDDGAARATVPKHILAWQSKVGYLPWMVPSTADALEKLGKAGHKSILVVPIAFTSDHIETLFEIGIEYRHLAKEHGFESFDMTEGLNGSPTFIKALAEICNDHMEKQVNYSPQYKMKCLGCEKPYCRGIVGAAY